MKRFLITAAALLLLFSVRSADAKDISVLLKQNAQQCTVAGTSYYITAPGAAAAERSGQITLSANGGMLTGASVPYSLPAEITSNNPITVNGKTYHGRILLDGSSGSFNIVNILDINDYLKGVVAVEMGAGWPLEALKAQAVLSRTYVLEGKRHGKYDTCASVHCQHYNGIKNETAVIVQAVDSTDGEILKYGGAPARVHYFSESGGCTASARSVWHTDVPYLRAKPDPVPTKGPSARWQATFPMSKLSSCLQSSRLYSGSVSSLRIAERDESGRVTKVEVSGSAGRTVIDGSKFRAALAPYGLKSTLFEFTGASGASAAAPSAPYQNPAAQVIYSSYNPPVSRNVANASIDTSTMPENEEDILYWMGRNKVFTVQELVTMIGKKSEYPKYIAEGKRRIEAARGGQPAQPQKQTAQNSVPAQQPVQPSAPALSDSTAAGYSVTISGRGAGHGVGLPQWSAKAMAENGWDYRRILDYYFSGTVLEKTGY
ncbi:MAG: SpoIID/LytB domain-containing protein [Synergistes sp.]|nr:SpoIID/LytB domain-containing protein [Synergistes sp.]